MLDWKHRLLSTEPVEVPCWVQGYDHIRTHIQHSLLTAQRLTHQPHQLKVKGRDIYIPPLTGKPWPAAVYNAKWRTDQQWHRWCGASSSSPLPEWTDFGPRSLQPDSLRQTQLCPSQPHYGLSRGMSKYICQPGLHEPVKFTALPRTSIWIGRVTATSSLLHILHTFCDFLLNCTPTR